MLARQITCKLVQKTQHLLQPELLSHLLRYAKFSSCYLIFYLNGGQTPEEPKSNPVFLSTGSQSVSSQIETETALHHLFAAFPAEEDAEILLRESRIPSLYVNVLHTQPHSNLTYETLSAPCSIPEMPHPNTHPVILATCMLMFAITLQSPSRENCRGLSEPHGVLMRRLLTAATTWVTTKEEMQGTVESLICIILEGIFEVNCGNLRRAWVVYRRALTVAQLMGLHRTPMPQLKRIDPSLDAKPEFLWFRIVYMDHYLSLLLGLPRGTSDKSVKAMSVLQHEPPLGQLERLLTVVASRILERNESTFDASEITTTQSIDSELLRISRSMPASFWRPVNFNHLTPGSPDSLLETVRLGAQVYYYGLLIHLHLPYMIQIGDNIEQEYSKITCLNASREILSRFIAHRNFNPLSSCSRPVDFFALLAAMVLLLAHLDARNREAPDLLAHQRLSDRSTLDQALERMDVISEYDKDMITEKSAILIRRLLNIEADAAGGSDYTTQSVGGDGEVPNDNGESEELRLHIPYLGVIKIIRQGLVSREPWVEHTASQPPANSYSEGPYGRQLAASNQTLVSQHHTSPTPERLLSRSSYADPGCAFSGVSTTSDRPNTHSQPSEYEQPILQPTSSNSETLGVQSSTGVLPLGAGVDDWTFQGVDTAFFDSLMRGMACADTIGSERQ